MKRDRRQPRDSQRCSLGQWCGRSPKREVILRHFQGELERRADFRLICRIPLASSLHRVLC